MIGCLACRYTLTKALITDLSFREADVKAEHFERKRYQLEAEIQTQEKKYDELQAKYQDMIKEFEELSSQLEQL